MGRLCYSRSHVSPLRPSSTQFLLHDLMLHRQDIMFHVLIVLSGTSQSLPCFVVSTLAP